MPTHIQTELYSYCLDLSNIYSYRILINDGKTLALKDVLLLWQLIFPILHALVLPGEKKILTPLVNKRYYCHRAVMRKTRTPFLRVSNLP